MLITYYPGSKTAIQGLRSANVLLGDTSSEASFRWAEDCIRTCETSHTQCGRGRGVPLPKRCVDLEFRQGINDSEVRLAETEGLIGTYACLSHCWGSGTKPLQTMITTLNDHLNGISLPALPKTFQDAVVIARRLGLKYLWIDSLCIIQDSAQDWQTESGKMADIYRNSFITITAISSPDSHGGCFSPEVLSDLCFRLEGRHIDTLIAAQYSEGDGVVSKLAAFEKAYPVLTRAWIYQERMLSRRVLRCHHREFQFECREGNACECGNGYLPPHIVPNTAASLELVQEKSEYAELEQSLGTNGGSATDQTSQQHWQKPVMQYAKLRLTKESDRLPALSGCAKDFNRLLGDKCLAGLWRTSLAQGMLWAVNFPIDQPRPAVWTAPSWS